MVGTNVPAELDSAPFILPQSQDERSGSRRKRRSQTLEEEPPFRSDSIATRPPRNDTTGYGMSPSC